MLFEALMSQFKASIDFSLGIKTNLLEKDRQTTSDLYIAKAKFINFDDLFSLAVVSYISLVTESSIKITSSSFERRSSSYKTIFDFSSLIEYFEATDISLNYRSFPVFWCDLLVELLQELFIPDKRSSNLRGLLFSERQS